MQIYKFNQILKPVLWGGDKLLSFKNLPPTGEPIGESWELSAMAGRESVVAEGADRGRTLTELVRLHGASLVGEDVYRRYGESFPLLIKLIDAKRDLSIQVHPDEAMARRCHGCSGKNEMWYVIQADEGGLVHTGFNRPMSPDEYDRRMADDSIMEVINSVTGKPGDAFFIPAGQIHAIGAGLLLAEIQQASDITYRIYDYNRRDAQGNLRELHTSQAREALSYEPYDGRVDYEPCEGDGVTPVVCCPDFEVERVDFASGYTMRLQQPHSFVVMMCLNGETDLMADGMPAIHLRQGETALVPAIVDEIEMNGSAQLLTAMVPVKKN